MPTEPRKRPASAGARGPIARNPPRSPTGYRVDERRKFELEAAQLFTGQRSLQGVIDLAVQEFLDRLRTQEPDFDPTLDKLERAQQRRAGVVRIRIDDDQK